jgi:hypothetical protein
MAAHPIETLCTLKSLTALLNAALNATRLQQTYQRPLYAASPSARSTEWLGVSWNWLSRSPCNTGLLRALSGCSSSSLLSTTNTALALVASPPLAAAAAAAAAAAVGHDVYPADAADRAVRKQQLLQM